MRAVAALLGLLAPLAVALCGVDAANAQVVKIGSKNFTEQFVVAELYAAALERAGFTVERKINLGSTLVAHEALKTGAIDLYPEYTGTGLLAVVRGAPDTDAERVFDTVKRFYEREFNLTWLPPSRVNNGYAMVVRPETAARHGLRTLGDLARVSKTMTLGGGSEFFDRFDGLPGLKAVYGIEFAESRQFAALRLRYEALLQRRVEVVNGFSTDWQIAAERFVTLTDDRGLFPPYHLAPVVRREIGADAAIVSALAGVNALLDNAVMQELNREVEVERRDPRAVAAEFLRARGWTR